MLGETHGQQIAGPGYRGVLDQAVGAEPSDAVQAFTRHEITLGHGHDLTRCRPLRCHGGVVKLDRPADCGCDLEVGQMKWSMEDVERPASHLVVGELGLLERIDLVYHHEGSGAGCCSQGVVDNSTA